ncbi:MAG: alpha/beta fold hydrolase [Terriglobales bacterium]|jgi:pimeloyl-ACP methyl ester carboxylesterase
MHPQSFIVEKLSSSRHSFIRPFLCVVAFLYIAGTVFSGIGLGWIALHPPSHPVTPSEERNARAAAQRDNVEFQDVVLVASDGAVLRAWFMRPSEPSGDAVILLHGVSDNRMGTYGYGRWLVQHHYMVLLPDARAHGNSSGEFATYGLKEADDVHRWVNWIETAEHPRCMFGLGESMGAAQLLQSLPKEPRFCAVVAESPFASFREVAYVRFGQPFHAGPWLGRTLFRPAVNAGFLYVRLRYGFDMEDASPEQAVVGSKIPVLLIHGLDDSNIPPYHSDLIQAKNPSDVVVWKVPGAFHTGAHEAAPQEFERRVLEWFAEHSSTAKPASDTGSN